MASFTVKEVLESFLDRNKDLYPNLTIEQMLEFNALEAKQANFSLTDSLFSDKTKNVIVRSIEIEFDGIELDTLMDALRKGKKRGASLVEFSDISLDIITRKEMTFEEVVDEWSNYLKWFADRCFKYYYVFDEIERTQKQILDLKKKLKKLTEE